MMHPSSRKTLGRANRVFLTSAVMAGTDQAHAPGVLPTNLLFAISPSHIKIR